MFRENALNIRFACEAAFIRSLQTAVDAGEFLGRGMIEPAAHRHFHLTSNLSEFVLRLARPSLNPPHDLFESFACHTRKYSEFRARLPLAPYAAFRVAKNSRMRPSALRMFSVELAYESRT
jgi:hypothetical protein